MNTDFIPEKCIVSKIFIRKLLLLLDHLKNHKDMVIVMLEMKWFKYTKTHTMLLDGKDRGKKNLV